MTGLSRAPDLDTLMGDLRRRHPHETVFHQAVREVLAGVLPLVHRTPRYLETNVVERLLEPDRVVGFRVTWMDDAGRVRVDRAWRVQFNGAIGPYKGGLRFHPDVTLDTLKFLGFEQTFKNSLTGLPIGGAKGGSDFDPKGKSEGEVMRFCQAMMSELYRHIGERTDVPAGDIGVGEREIGYLFGQYRRLTNRFAGAMTGKGLAFGGSAGRKQATGHGVVYMLHEVLVARGEALEGKTAVVSGSGNVALHTIEKLGALGAKVVSASDSSGFVHDPEGIAGERLAWLVDLKERRRGRIREYAEEFGCRLYEGERPWRVPCDFAFPCATQNELDGDDAARLIEGGVSVVVEGANMPSTPAALARFREGGVVFVPGKAANAGGVAVSALEQSQNAQHTVWPAAEVDARLHEIMCRIHDACVEHGGGGEDGERVDYVLGANRAGFLRVADAMAAYGAV